MNILGHVKSSLIDFPGRASTILFVGGCNFRCPYCHNPDIVLNMLEPIEPKKIFDFLKKRKRFLDGVCISGGEPALYGELYGFIREIKALDYDVKLDTNGTNPEMLEKLIGENLVDYIAMDIKAPIEKYKKIVKTDIDTENIKESIRLLLNGHVGYEFRTTVCSELMSAKDILAILDMIKGAERYCIQNFRDSGKILANRTFTPFSQEKLEKIRRIADEHVREVIVR